MTKVDTAQPFARQYRAIHRTGGLAVLLGGLQLLLVPVLAILIFGANTDPSAKLQAVLLNSAIMLLAGIPLVVWGWRLWRLRPGDDVARAEAARFRLQLVVAGGLAVAAVTGGRVGIVLMVMLLALYLAGRHVRTIQAGRPVHQDPPPSVPAQRG